MSVYRRGAVYWWGRTVALGNGQLESIRLRVSLKTSDKSEAKRRAAMLEVELDMVAVRFPVSEANVLPGQLLVMFKQALEYKRDQISHIQSRPPYNDAEHRRYNTAYSRIFGAIAHTGLAPNNPKTLALALDDEKLGETERDLIRQLSLIHGNSEQPIISDIFKPETIEQSFAMATQQQGMCNPPIAPRLVMNFMENAGLSDKPLHKQIALAVTAAAYGKACIDANQRLGALTDNTEFVVSVSLQMQMGLKAEQDLSKFNPSAGTHSLGEAHAQPTSHNKASTTNVTALPAAETLMHPATNGCVNLQPVAPPHPAIKPGAIDLKISELCDRAITEYRRTNTWADSAQRNARVITDIFITENGDLRASSITRNHLMNLSDRLHKMPAVWGKSREDRQGGLRHVFYRGEQLAAIWSADKSKAERDKVPKVGLSAGTYNRHIKTLKQVIDFVEVIAEIDQGQIYARNSASFARLHEKDDRRKNKLKPVPLPSELQTLISGPIYTGCESMSARFSAGSLIIHDGAYWMPLLLIVYGPRSNEFCQMPLANVKVDVPVPYFRIRKSNHQTVPRQHQWHRFDVVI